MERPWHTSSTYDKTRVYGAMIVIHLGGQNWRLLRDFLRNIGIVHIGLQIQHYKTFLVK